MLDTLPVPDGVPTRTEGDAAVPAPPLPTPLLRGGRPLKRWRYAGVFGADVMICAASVRIAGVPQWFWAVWDRRERRLVETTRFLPGGVALPDGLLRIRGRRVRADVLLEAAGTPVATLSRHGDGWIWTRKLPVRGRGTVLAGGRAIDVDAAGLIDDSAGYHARQTSWWWSAGVGTTADGAAVAWNLTDGIHDAPASSERTVWVDGVPSEPGPVAFAPDLSAVTGPGGTDLRFAAEAERARRDDLLVVRSDYRQPFGTFSGALAGGVTLAEGRGVMERHDALW